MIMGKVHDPRSGACPWCQEPLQLAFPNLDSPPEYSRVTKPGFELDERGG